VDAVFLKPLDRDLLLEEARRTGRVVTAEENVLQGGFGSAVLELFQQEQVDSVRTLCIGLPDEFVEQGTQQQLRQRHGIDAGSMAERIRKWYA
jgi:1-deoxy-D-xylulose-5-phosphate synthase